MDSHLALVRDHAARLHLDFPLLVAESMDIPWLAMRGRLDEADAKLAAVTALGQRIAVQNVGDAIAGALVAVRIWQQRTPEVAPLVALVAETGGLPVNAVVLVLWLRGGELDKARAYAAEHPAEPVVDDWFSMLERGCAAEAALGLGDPALGEVAYNLLVAHAGETVCAGSGSALGPVDAFLAMAAAARGDLEAAGRHADDAIALMATWQSVAARPFGLVFGS
jgi:hypothetical protein